METPQPEKEDREIFHGRRLAQGDPESVWGWGTPAGRVRAQRRADWIARQARLGPGRRTLEIGCGTGVFTEKFALTGTDLTAMDISPELLEIARAKNIFSERVRFVAGKFEDCPLEGPFDAVIGSSVLHHLEVIPALAKVKALLKPGGVMVFAEPNMLNPIILLQKNIPWLKRRLGDSPDETAFIRWPLQGWLEKIGFKKIEIVPLDWLFPATPPGWIPLVKKLESSLERLPLVRELAGSLYIKALV